MTRSQAVRALLIEAAHKIADAVELVIDEQPATSKPVAERKRAERSGVRRPRRSDAPSELARERARRLAREHGMIGVE